MLQSSSLDVASGQHEMLFLPEMVHRNMSVKQLEQYHRQQALFSSQSIKLSQIIALQQHLTGKDPLSVEIPPRQAAQMPVVKTVLAASPQKG